MMTNNPNANLIEAMKEKLPLKGQLADMLMDRVGSYFKKTGYIARQDYRTKFQIERHV